MLDFGLSVLSGGRMASRLPKRHRPETRSPRTVLFAVLGAGVALEADADELPLVVLPAVEFVEMLPARQSGQSQSAPVTGMTRISWKDNTCCSLLCKEPKH